MPTIHHGDCIETMKAMPPESVDAIVTDPPYGLGFMGRKWDALPPSQEWAEACYRVLKPGGHIAAFGGTRTWHRLAVAIEDAGFEMRDSLAWLYGSGFPKSMNVGKAIDATVLTGKSGSRSIREATDSREVIGTKMGMPGKSAGQKPGTYFSEAMEAEDGKDLDIRAERLGGSIAEGGHRRDLDITAPATPEAAQWDGWGTALKPAFEPIVLARKPLAEKTVARNVLAHGTGAINVDACRIGTEDNLSGVGEGTGKAGSFRFGGYLTFEALQAAAETDEVTPDGKNRARAVLARAMSTHSERVSNAKGGRWPANVLLDQHAAAWVDEQSGVSVSRASESRATQGGGMLLLHGCRTVDELRALAEAGEKTPDGRDARTTLARFEASEGRPPSLYADSGGASRFFYTAKAPKSERPNVDGVQHPTVKPLAIMRWLIRLVTPPGGTVLDPFAGSGTTIEAALIEGFNPVGIEMETDYLPLIQHRIDRQAGTLTA